MQFNDYFLSYMQERADLLRNPALAQLFCHTVPAKQFDRYKEEERRRKDQLLSSTVVKAEIYSSQCYRREQPGQWSAGDLSLTTLEDNAAEMYTALTQSTDTVVKIKQESLLLTVTVKKLWCEMSCFPNRWR